MDEFKQNWWVLKELRDGGYCRKYQIIRNDRNGWWKGIKQGATGPAICEGKDDADATNDTLGKDIWVGCQCISSLCFSILCVNARTFWNAHVL